MGSWFMFSSSRLRGLCRALYEQAHRSPPAARAIGHHRYCRYSSSSITLPSASRLQRLRSRHRNRLAERVVEVAVIGCWFRLFCFSRRIELVRAPPSCGTRSAAGASLRSTKRRANAFRLRRAVSASGRRHGTQTVPRRPSRCCRSAYTNGEEERNELLAKRPLANWRGYFRMLWLW